MYTGRPAAAVSTRSRMAWLIEKLRRAAGATSPYGEAPLGEQGTKCVHLGRRVRGVVTSANSWGMPMRRYFALASGLKLTSSTGRAGSISTTRSAIAPRFSGVAV